MANEIVTSGDYGEQKSIRTFERVANPNLRNFLEKNEEKRVLSVKKWPMHSTVLVPLAATIGIPREVSFEIFKTITNYKIVEGEIDYNGYRVFDEENFRAIECIYEGLTAPLKDLKLGTRIVIDVGSILPPLRRALGDDPLAQLIKDPEVENSYRPLVEVRLNSHLNRNAGYNQNPGGINSKQELVEEKKKRYISRKELADGEKWDRLAIINASDALAISFEDRVSYAKYSPAVVRMAMFVGCALAKSRDYETLEAIKSDEREISPKELRFAFMTCLGVMAKIPKAKTLTRTYLGVRNWWMKRDERIASF